MRKKHAKGNKSMESLQTKVMNHQTKNSNPTVWNVVLSLGMLKQHTFGISCLLPYVWLDVSGSFVWNLTISTTMRHRPKIRALHYTNVTQAKNNKREKKKKPINTKHKHAMSVDSHSSLIRCIDLQHVHIDY